MRAASLTPSPSLPLFSLLSQPSQPTNLLYIYTRKRPCTYAGVRVTQRLRSCAHARARARAKLFDEALHVKHDDEDDYHETIIYPPSIFRGYIRRGYTSRIIETSKKYRVIVRGMSSSTSVTFTSRTSRDVPRRREGTGESFWGTGKRRGIYATASTRGSSSPSGEEKQLTRREKGGGRQNGKEEGREVSAADRDGVDVQVITRYVNPYNVKLT